MSPRLPSMSRFALVHGRYEKGVNQVAFWKRNRGIIAFSLLAVVLLGFVAHNARQREQHSLVEEYVMRAVAPIEKGVSSLVRSIGGVFSGFRELLHIRAENQRLRSELLALQSQFNLLVETERENLRLRQLLEYRQQNPQLKAMLAKVIGTSSNPLQQEIVLDRGAQHGVAINMPVITHEGFVGRVFEVAKDSCKVLLVLDPRGPVVAQVQETRARGTIEVHPQIPGMLRLIRLPREADVQEGYTVITAGTGGLSLPKGVIIGQVENASPSPDGLQLVATVRPSVNFNRLEEVLIVTQAGGR